MQETHVAVDQVPPQGDGHGLVAAASKGAAPKTRPFRVPRPRLGEPEGPGENCRAFRWLGVSLAPNISSGDIARLCAVWLECNRERRETLEIHADDFYVDFGTLRKQFRFGTEKNLHELRSLEEYLSRTLLRVTTMSVLLLKKTCPTAVFLFAQATFVHVQKVPKIFLHRNVFCTFKKCVFWHVKPLKISV